MSNLPNATLADITFRLVPPKNWRLIERDVINLEKPFYEGRSLDGDADYYRDTFSHPKSTIYVAEHQGRVIGVVHCLPADAEPILAQFREDDGSPSDFFEERGQNSCYGHTVTVHPDYHKMGIGSTLLDMAMKDAKIRGYNSFSGYCNHETSKGLLDKANPYISKTIKNFGDSGEDYEFGVIDLDKFEPKGVSQALQRI